MTSEHPADAPLKQVIHKPAFIWFQFKKHKLLMCPMCMMPAVASMRGGSMAPMGLMGMLGDGPTHPKVRRRMLQLRSEMLKAMGEVMLKHAQPLEQTS